MQKVTLKDFELIETSEFDSIAKFSEGLTPSKALLEGYGMDANFRASWETIDRDAREFISEAITASNISKAEMILSHSNDEILQSLNLSAGNIMKFKYYNTVMDMLKDIKTVAKHNQEIIKADQILTSLDLNKHVYMHAFSKNDFIRKMVYTTSAIVAIYTVIKEHAAYIDFTESKNQDKIIMNHHIVSENVDKNNVAQLDRSLRVMHDITSHSQTSHGIKLKESNAFGTFFQAQGMQHIVETGTEAAATAAAEGAKKGLWDQFKDGLASVKDSLTPDWWDGLNKLTKEGAKTLQVQNELTAVGPGMTKLRQVFDYLVGKFADGLVNMGKGIQWTAGKGRQAFEYVAASFGLTSTTLAMVLSLCIGSFFIIKTLFKGNFVLDYIKSVEHIKDAASKSHNLHGDRAIFKILDKMSNFRKKVKDAMRNMKSRNIQDYMKDINKDHKMVQAYDRNEVNAGILKHSTSRSEDNSFF